LALLDLARRAGAAVTLKTASETPTQQRAKARTTRGLKIPALENKFFFMS
jgi:hypothetical protein